MGGQLGMTLFVGVVEMQELEVLGVGCSATCVRALMCVGVMAIHGQRWGFD